MYIKEELLKKLDEKYKVTLTNDHLIINGVPVVLNDFRHSEVRSDKQEQEFDKFKKAIGIKKTSAKLYDLKKLEKYVNDINKDDEKNWD